MLRPPPRSPLFPYTTLFRSEELASVRAGGLSDGFRRAFGDDLTTLIAALGAEDGDERSEEHTSELQSEFHLVCRLVRDKKNKTAAAVERRLCVAVQVEHRLR